MTKIQKNFIVEMMGPEDVFPKLLTEYIKNRFKCTKHIAKEVTKTLINDRTRLN